jgi:hypothetical protein
MNEPHSLSDQQIDDLVRAHLTQQEATGDAGRILARVQARLAAQTVAQPSETERLPFEQPPRSRWRRGLVLRLAVAAAVLLALFLTLQVGPNPVSATTLVQDAQKVHALPVDRCYLVQTDVAPDVADNYQLLPVTRAARLWTRGDRFWMESPRQDHQGGWGRDEKGRVWFAAPHRKAGFRFEADEIPESLRISCGLRSMRVETLLKEILAEFDLREGPSKDGPKGPVRVVQATLKPGRKRPLRAATVEMDSAKKVLQRVVLSRVYKDAVSTVTLTLVEEGLQPDDVYRLESHLEPEAHIFSKEEPPPRRLQMLRRQYELARPDKPVTNR